MFDVTALDIANGDETYALSVETDSVAFKDSPVKIGLTATGAYELERLAGRDTGPNAAAVRVKATLSGTNPSITYGALLVPA